ncbi:uncharacterized protein LOC128677315 [Plodia interpunctella]|uniref:uncharacterized protein LOC128677315 n=1 Tax=Plodia interpunctella TaxID=58824 RepID=UPI0023686723|nr:uncharacterized protein LOC128677315 [Plodia interpunctella]
MPLKRTPPQTPTNSSPLPRPEATVMSALLHDDRSTLQSSKAEISMHPNPVIIDAATTSQPPTTLFAPRLPPHFSGSDSALNKHENVTVRPKRKFVSEEESSMRDFMQEMKNMFVTFEESQNQKYAYLQSTLNEIKEKNLEIANSLDFLSQKYDEIILKVSKLEADSKNSQSHIQGLEAKIEHLERKARLCAVEIRNIPKINPNETKEDLCKTAQIIGEAVDVQIKSEEIKDIYRLSSKQESAKPIVVEFTTLLKKDKLLSSIKSYNRQNGNNKLNTTILKMSCPDRPIYVSEALTFKAKRLYYLAREYAKINDYQFCWTSNGTVQLRKRENGPIIRINSEEDFPKTDK